MDIGRLRFDDRGLIPVIAQAADTGEVLMLAWATKEALEASRSTCRMTYYSRSRQGLWQKGETSGNFQELRRMESDCDQDAVLALVHQSGPACHTGAATCFGEPGPLLPTLAQLDRTISDRALKRPAGSYTTRLLEDSGLAAKKIGEEAAELVRALACESPDRVASEAADLLYHALAACAGRGIGLREVAAKLAERASPTR